MSRYSQEQLTDMAKTALHDRDHGMSVKWLQLVVTVGSIYGIGVSEVERRIEMMASGDFTFQ